MSLIAYIYRKGSYTCHYSPKNIKSYMYIMVLDRNVMGFREFFIGQFDSKSMIKLKTKHIQIDSNNQAGARKCLFRFNISPFNCGGGGIYFSEKGISLSI